MDCNLVIQTRKDCVKTKRLTTRRILRKLHRAYPVDCDDPWIGKLLDEYWYRFDNAARRTRRRRDRCYSIMKETGCIIPE